MKVFFSLCFVTIVTLWNCNSVSASKFNNFNQCWKQLQEDGRELTRITGSHESYNIDDLWMAIFHDLDLNKNGKVSAPEIVLKLEQDKLDEKEKLKHSVEYIQQWMDAIPSYTKQEKEEKELDFERYLQRMKKAVKTLDSDKTNVERVEGLELDICEIGTKAIPRIIHAIRLLKNCSTELKRDQLKALVSNKKKLIANTWRTVFSEIDGDNDNTLSSTDLSRAYLQSHKQENVSGKDVQSQMSALLWNTKFNRMEFFKELTTILFDAHEWTNLTSMNQARGKQMFCSTLRNMRQEVVGWIKKNLECIDLFKLTRDKILGVYGDIAGQYITSMIDGNRDGKMTVPEVLHYIKQNATFLADYYGSNGTVFNKTMKAMIASKETKSDDFPELYTMSLKAHQNWNLFCLTAIETISNFPSSSDPSRIEKPSRLRLIEILGQKLKSHLAPSDKEYVKLEVLGDTIKRVIGHHENKEDRRDHVQETDGEEELRNLLNQEALHRE